MIFKPLPNYLICKKLEDVSLPTNRLVVPVESPHVQVFEVEYANIEQDFVKVGDRVICNSTGTSIDDDRKLFNVENVAAVVNN